ncbi:MAG: branched-chain-amino-acid transaminase [Bdellovibrionales bacterium RIFOXYD1_FULL_53_11]|nr:MAG: branched-chain-amino-acid transaminase [Bdellovibrionales bacterium RIFOXYD1_FULL_53_11]
MRGSQVWYNGRIIAAENAKISLFTHGLHYGFGAFEGIRAYKLKRGGGAIFRLEDHLERLYDSARILDLKIPYSIDELIRATLAICKENKFEECYLRHIIFTADGPLGLNHGDNPPVDIAILAWEWGSYLGDKNVKEGARLKISSFCRPHVNSIMTKGKITGQYVVSCLAKREAISQGFDEALLLDHEGYLAEGSGENIFMVRDGIVKTTPLTSILGGITRRTVIAYLKQQGMELVETRFTRDELWCADEIFLTGTAAEITPVREIDYRVIGRGQYAGKPGPLTTQIQKDYRAITRGELKLPGGKAWLTPVK